MTDETTTTEARQWLALVVGLAVLALMLLSIPAGLVLIGSGGFGAVVGGALLALDAAAVLWLFGDSLRDARSSLRGYVKGYRS